MATYKKTITTQTTPVNDELLKYDELFAIKVDELEDAILEVIGDTDLDTMFNYPSGDNDPQDVLITTEVELPESLVSKLGLLRVDDMEIM